jgi:hypothetical protein
MLHFEVVSYKCAATNEKKISLADNNGKFLVVKMFPKEVYANTVGIKIPDI